MQILLTGFTGRIGKHILKTLHSRGHEVRGLLSPSRTSAPEGLESYLSGTVNGDIQKVDDWKKALEGMDAVVHLAGRSEEAPDALSLNVSSTHSLVQACDAVDVRNVVFASSNCVLGQCYREGDPALELDYLPVDEKHRLMPCMDYGVSKQCAENVLEAAAERYNLKVRAFRLAWMLSDEDCKKKVFAELNDKLQAASMWTYLHLDDAARAFCLAAETEQGNTNRFEAMYLNAGDTFSMTPSIELAQKYYSHIADTAVDLKEFESFYSWKRAHEVIGYTPEKSWRDFQ